MKFRIYLHQYIIDILKFYGDISTVINKILKLGEDGTIDLCNKPKAPSRDNTSQINVNITNQYYLDLIGYYPSNSTTGSLRRLIYWFVDNELFDEYNFVPIDSKEVKTKKAIGYIYTISDCIRKLKKSLPNLKDDLQILEKSVEYIKNKF